MRKIKNLKQKIKSSSGYTLIEMLAAIIVFSIMGGIIAAIFISSLRGSNKADIENEVRQNGNYALSQMSKIITYARAFDNIRESESSEAIPRCYGLEPTQQYHYLQVLDFDNNLITFVCDSAADPQIASNGASLIDETLVNVESCNLYCSQSSYFSPPIIKIELNLTQESSSNLFEHKASIPFETTVIMRNISF